MLDTVLTSSAERFDPVTETFSLTGVMNTARSSFTATNLDDGTVLLVGGWEFYDGYGLAYVPAATAEIYDPD